MSEFKSTCDSIAASNILTAAFDEPIPHEIEFMDDTLRDGEQTVGVSFSVEQKVEIARSLIDAGVTRMCAGFPAVSEEERAATRAIMSLLRPGLDFHCLCRAIPSDIDAALASGSNHAGLFLATSDLHLEKKYKTDEQGAVAKLVSAIRYARDKNMDVSVGLEDATRTPLDRLLRIIKVLVECEVKLVVFSDTVGALTPRATHGIVRELVRELGDVPLFVHFHNDLGLAVANSLAAFQAGARGVEGSVVGLGERGGNVCFEEVAVALRVKYGRAQNINLPKLISSATRIAEIAKLPIAAAKPVVGGNAFRHESGIHVHGILSEPATYEPYPPALIGRKHEIQYGKHSGMVSMRHLAKSGGIETSDAVLDEALLQIKKRAVDIGSPSPEEALAILRAVVNGRT